MKLQLTDVTKRFGGRQVVNVPELAIGAHGIEGLIGPNGAGKTTLMNLIMRRLPLDTGQVTWHANGDPVEISRLTVEQIARLGIVKTNQIVQDFESLTIIDSFLLSLADSGFEKFYRVFSDKELRRQTEHEIAGYLDFFHFEAPNGRALSAGEKKLLNIIRCLLLKPRFLLMDEPTAGLPDEQKTKVMEFIRRKVAEDDLSILIVEHNLDLIWNVCEWVSFMADGEIIIQGPPDEIRGDRTLAEKYLGKDHV